jgi:predicted peptidase
MSSTIAKHRFVSGDGDNDLPYLLALPRGYEETGEPWPLLLFLHGAGERGEDLDLVSVYGPIRRIGP